MSKHTDDDIDALLHGHVPAGDEDLPILADVVEAVRTGTLPIVRRTPTAPTAVIPDAAATAAFAPGSEVTAATAASAAESEVSSPDAASAAGAGEDALSDALVDDSRDDLDDSHGDNDRLGGGSTGDDHVDDDFSEVDDFSDDEDFLDGEAEHEGFALVGDGLDLPGDGLDLPDDVLDELDGEGDAVGESWTPVPVAAAAAATVPVAAVANESATDVEPASALALPSSVAVPRPPRALRRLGVSAGLSVAAAAVVGVTVGTAGFLPAPVQDAFDYVVGREAIEDEQSTVPIGPQGGGGVTEGVVRTTPTPSGPASAEPTPLPSEPQSSPTPSDEATEPAQDEPTTSTREGGNSGAEQRGQSPVPSVAPQQPSSPAPQPSTPSPAPAPSSTPTTPTPEPALPVPTVPAVPVPEVEVPADDTIADELKRQLQQWTEPTETAPPSDQ
ncbi:hypothetical protein [Desertivibrio insolitus]|uniref:hypothetical protein n=1 Tax=Herbiconiux sp. SYSU D00978 TaxID=2812562 RepID=UPI001A9592A3|nr:hypothetical protein [Herbiconiux sp. SYSU D00978]